MINLKTKKECWACTGTGWRSIGSRPSQIPCDICHIEDKLEGTYKNRIEQYNLETGSNIPTVPPVEAKDPEPTCEHCKFRREEYCNRYPQRLIIKNQAGYLPACGEFKIG